MARSRPVVPGSPGQTEEREKSKRLGALKALLPFLRPYQALVAGALAALVVTAFVSLTLPLAVRRVVDNFYTKDPQTLDLYFAAALGIDLLGLKAPNLLISKHFQRTHAI